MRRLLRILLLGLIGLATFNLQMRLVPHRASSRSLVGGLALMVAALTAASGDVLIAGFMVALGLAALVLQPGRPESPCPTTAMGYVLCLMVLVAVAVDALLGARATVLLNAFAVLVPLVYLKRIRDHQAKLVRGAG